MGKRTKKSVARPTPKQRRKQARIRRDNARTLEFCNGLELWERCHVAACRRNHSCRSDVHTCFTRHWQSVSSDVMAFVRGRIDASEEGLAPAAAVRAAIKARLRHLEWRGLIRRSGNAV